MLARHELFPCLVHLFILPTKILVGGISLVLTAVHPPSKFLLRAVLTILRSSRYDSPILLRCELRFFSCNGRDPGLYNDKF